jgi:hypothetical protein
MIERFASDLGAWSFVVWTIVLVLCAAAVLWVVTTVVARTRRNGIAEPVRVRHDR